MNLVLVGILLYVLAQLAIGLFVARRTHSESDYLLAGRSFGPGVLTMTLFATWFGAETCLGSSGEVYSQGLVGARLDPFGYTTCLVMMGLFFAVPLWKRGFTTLADLFRERFSTGVERLGVILLVPTSVIWAGAQILAFGHVLSASSELSLSVAIFLSAAAVILYTTMGGLRADAITDVLQGGVLIGGLLLLLGIVIYGYSGGDYPPVDPVRLKPFGAEEEAPLAQMEAWCIPLIGSVLSQELVARALAARSAGVARAACFSSAGLYLAVGMIPVTLGILGPSLMPNLENPEHFLPALAQAHLNKFLYVLFAGALVSAILSTVDSALLAAGSLFSHNLLLPILKTRDERIKLRVSRISVFAFGIVAYLLALHGGRVRDLVEEASAFGSTGVFVVVVFGLFTRYGGLLAAYSSLLVGVTVYVLGCYGIPPFPLGSDSEGASARLLEPIEYPYLFSLASALVAYVAVGALEAALVRNRPILMEPRPAEEET